MRRAADIYRGEAITDSREAYMLADRKRAAGKRHDAALICLTCHGRNANLAMLTTRQPNHGPSKAQQAEVADAA